MTRNEALALGESGVIDNLDDLSLFWFQINEPLLCCTFGRFQEATEKALGRPVWTHEFADPDSLRSEFLRERSAPTMLEIMEKIPAEKRVLVVTGGAQA